MLATTDPDGSPRVVLFRIEENGARLFVFPYAPGSTADPCMMDAYSPTDGATCAAPGYVREHTRRATLDESKAMSAWLDAQGVKHCELLQIPSTAFAKRLQALRSR